LLPLWNAIFKNDGDLPAARSAFTKPGRLATKVEDEVEFF
jgi:hypothetical protein